MMKSEEFEELWEEINCKKEPEEGTSSIEGLGAEFFEILSTKNGILRKVPNV